VLHQGAVASSLSGDRLALVKRPELRHYTAVAFSPGSPSNSAAERCSRRACFPSSGRVCS
jgi:hypothetical protein